MNDWRKDIDRLLDGIQDERLLEKIYWRIVRLVSRTMEGDQA